MLEIELIPSLLQYLIAIDPVSIITVLNQLKLVMLHVTEILSNIAIGEEQLKQEKFGETIGMNN